MVIPKKYGGPLRPGEWEKLAFTDWNVQRKGLFGRLVKTYWKRALLVLIMLGFGFAGWVMLGLCAAVWLLNWSNEMTSYKAEDPAYQQFLEELKKAGCKVEK